MIRVTLVAIVLAAATAVRCQTNPFEGIPPLVGLPVCNTECTPVGQAQSSWNGDYSAFCTASFATSLTTCLGCIVNSSLGAVVNTPTAREQLGQAITAYQNACQQSGSPVTVNISSILGGPSATASGSGSVSTATQTSTTSALSGSTGAATKAGFGAGAMLGAVAFVAGTLF